TTAQQPDGQWTSGKIAIDKVPVIATSFALLFLSKGRTPILITKFAYGDFGVIENNTIVERGDEPGKIGWNRKMHDARHIVEYCSRELFQRAPLGWQVYDCRRTTIPPEKIAEEVGSLLSSPILYMNGHQKPRLTGVQKELLKRYIDEGGFLLAEACCGSPDFTNGMQELLAELFPDNALQEMPPEHPIWRAFHQVSPADFRGVKTLERGCKTVAVVSTVPLAGYWDQSTYMPASRQPAANRGQRAFHLAANIVAYATGMRMPEQRGTIIKVVDAAADLAPPRGAFWPAQLQLRSEVSPAPVAMRNLAGHLKDRFEIETVQDRKLIVAGTAELQKYKFLYVHGRSAIALEESERENLKLNLETGGLMLADACCGSKTFDESFRKLIQQLYPDMKLVPVPTDDELYSQTLNGVPIRTVQRREQLGGQGPESGFRALPPALEGIKIDGRWVVLYSRFDLGCALEGKISTDCLGHTKESALQLAAAAVLYQLKR
ncbi:MAG: DUF4159 domain-containing protein, partial [Gemmataceae bacterium]